MSKIGEIVGHFLRTKADPAHTPADASAGRLFTTDYKPAVVVLRDAAIKAKAEQRRPSLSDIAKLAQEKRYSTERKYRPEEISQMNGINFTMLLQELGVEQFVFDGEGLEMLRRWADKPSLAIDLRGSTLGGCVVTPESGFPGISVAAKIQPYEGVLLDHMTNVKGLIFEGFNLPTIMRFQHMDLEQAQFRGNRKKGPVQSGLYFQDCNVIGIDLAGAKLAHLTIERSALNYARLDDVSVIMIDANQSQMQGAHFNRASFGPDSRIIHTDCTCADFSGAVLDNLDLSHSTLYGVNLEGVDITRVNLTAAAIDPDSLIGAIGPDGLIQTLEQALAYMAAHGMKRASAHAANLIANAQSQALRYDTLRQKAQEKVLTAKIEQKRNMDVALQEVYKQMYSGQISWSAGAARSVDTAEPRSATQDNATTSRYKVDHSKEYVRNKNPLGSGT